VWKNQRASLLMRAKKAGSVVKKPLHRRQKRGR